MGQTFLDYNRKALWLGWRMGSFTCGAEVLMIIFITNKASVDKMFCCLLLTCAIFGSTVV